MKFIITANSMHWMWSFKICVFIHSFIRRYYKAIHPSPIHERLIEWLKKRSSNTFTCIIHLLTIHLLFRCFFVVRKREKVRNFIERKNKSFFESSSLLILHVKNNRLARNERLTVSVAKCYVKTHSRWTTVLCSSIAIEKKNWIKGAFW